MARTEGQVIKRRWKAGAGYALRFNAYKQRQYVTLGLAADGWTHKRAETELANILADVRRGTWIPPDRNNRTTKPGEQTPAGQLTFHAFASNWHADREGEVAERTHEYEQWTLSHLLPYFANWPLRDINIEAVDDYRRYKIQQAKQRQTAIENGKPDRDQNGRLIKPLSASSINKTIETLHAILALAVEYGHLASNPAAGKRRRLNTPQRPPVYLDAAEQIQALLDAASELDREPIWRINDRQAIIATLVLAGPRAHELCNLLWRDVDLANGRIHIGRSKTQAGLREIHLFPLLRDELAAHKARAYRAGPDDLVFPTGTGGHRDKDNLHKRVLAPAIPRADELLANRDKTPLPRGITPHKLRHTFASILVALGNDPNSVMYALGHTDPKFTLRVYSHLMRRDPTERAGLSALVNGGQLLFKPVNQSTRIAIT